MFFSKKIEFTEVRKRDGRVVTFDQSKITGAVSRAMQATGEGSAKEDAEKVSQAVIESLAKKFDKTSIPSIEEIQDVVETQLILSDFAKTAKAYILYRKDRAEIREKKASVPEHIAELARESKKYFRNPLAEFVYYRTYSRWIPEEGRRETWIETVDRYVSFMKENIGDKLTDAEYAEVREAILKQEAMPSMRLLQFAGKAARNTNVAAYNCSYIAPSKLEDFAEIMYISMCGTGVGFSVEGQTVQALPQIKKQTGKKLSAHVIADSKEGWCDALTLGLKTWFDGKDIDFDFSELRPAGARLKTMGGKSSGPEPLRALLMFARKKIISRQGRRLSNIDVHDICCKIGEIVVSGGVRRSAMISLSDLDDSEMRAAKTGQFYFAEPQRSMANNSAVYTEKPSAAQFLEEWISLAKSGTGERGLFNRGGLVYQMPERRKKILKNQLGKIGTNPCVTDDTWVLTSEGARQVSNLIHHPFTAIVNGTPHLSSGFWKTGEKEVFSVVTDRGFSFTATADHPVLAIEYQSRKIRRTSWKKVSELKTGDAIVLNNQSGVSWEGRGNETEGWLLGNLLGDGNIEKDGKANLDYWGTTQRVMMNQAVRFVHASVGGRSDLLGHVAKTGYARVGSTALGKLAISYGIHSKNKIVTQEIESSSSDFYLGFLRGWFDADGSVQGSHAKGISIRLSSNSLPNLECAQRMLARLGIIGTLYAHRRPPQMKLMPDGKGGMQEYFCEANHEIIISNSNIQTFHERIGFSDPEKKATLKSILTHYRRKLNREKFTTKIDSIVSAGSKSVYDCIVEVAHAFDGNGVVLHNCGEILLQSKEFCNLSEVVARAEDTEETLMKKLRIATILGTYQSTLTNLPYLSKEWRKNCETERLLGVSITGQWDCPAVRNEQVLAKMRDRAIEINKEYAHRFGINASASITCVKPSGTVSQTVDAASGLHARHAKYYIRRVRISATDGLFQMLKDQKYPYFPEVGQSISSASTFVLEFPVKAPEGGVTKDDLTALDQLEYWKKVKMNFTEHNPSVTVSVGANEWISVANWLYSNWDMIGGLSFLPREENAYLLAPYEEITKERYEEITAKLPDIDFAQILLYEKEDATDVKKELACVGGVCEIEEATLVKK